ncbi:MAG: type II secretion system F family protein [Candidatus Aenigmatarchaeota archaeon]
MFKVIIKHLGSFGIHYFGNYLKPLREEVINSNLSILFELYVGRMIFLSLLAFVLTFTFIFTAFTLIGADIMLSLMGSLIAGIATGFTVLTLYHSYPFHILTSKRNSIEGNLPFAINHMAAISASGVPPFVMFKLLTNIPEYGEISNEAKRICRNVDVFGMDVVSAMRNVSDRTPSVEFKRFIYGIVSTIETGGDIKKYLENSAKDALFDYRLKREKYIQTLATYADFYTAVLIAAPLFFVSVLSVMSLVGGTVMGLSIPNAMRIGVYALMPLMNIMFIMFIHYTQPTV